MINNCMIFINNKYTKLYFNIITIAKSRDNIDSYTEKHHILPKSLGGNNNEDNLVRLTAREHFICHWLLTKMVDGNFRNKMLYALNGMRRNKTGNRYSTKITSRVYASLKGKRKLTEETKLKISLSKKGKPRSEETVQKMRGQTRSEETKTKMSQALKGRIGPNLGKPRSEETKEKIRNTLSSRVLSAEAREKLKGPRGPRKISVKQESVTCPHCGKSGGKGNMNRYHFTNCSILDKAQGSVNTTHSIS